MQSTNYPRLIALCGAARHGKSTAANYLVEKHGYMSLKFSGALKDMCIDTLITNPPEFYLAQLTGKQMHDYHIDPRGFWIDKIHVNRDGFSRWLMQYVGTEIMRGYDSDCWVKLWRDQYVVARGNNQLVVVEDLRFLNEARAVGRFGGKIWRVVRTDADAPLIEAGEEHQSETEYLSIQPHAIASAPFGIHFVHEAIENLLTDAVTG